MNWNDFSTIGFNRTDARLSATLQFSTPVAHTISSWPTKNENITKKLKKTQRALPPFGWDTEPVMGSEEMVEEAFMDVFCDLVYGGGWMDIERGEETDRECNWALVNFLWSYFKWSFLLIHITQIEFKSLPLNRNSPQGGDPRTATTIFLFEEFVPLEYRQQLAKDSGTKRRLPFLFSPSSKSRPWKPAATLNGRPYVVGHVPKSPTLREVEFEGMLRSNGSKILSLSKAAPAIMISPVTQGDSDHIANSRPGTAGSGRISPIRQLERVASDTPLTGTPGSTKRRFRIPVPSPSVVRRSTLVPAEYSTVDFETRLASYSDDELNESASMKALTPAEKHERRVSRDDAWVDILVAAHSRRMGSQEAERRPGGKVLKGGRSDPELASQEVALVLAGVRARSPLSDDEGVQVRQPAVDPLPSVIPQEKPKEEDPDVESVMSYPKRKRVGYFDLHPERRPGGLSVRPQVNANDSDGDDVPDHLVYGTPEGTVIPASDPTRPSIETEASEYGPSATSSPRDIDFPEFVDYERRREEKESSHSRAESMTLPQLTQSNTDVPKSSSQSKTASLIEMYRERERQSLVSAPLSRTPVPSALIPPKNTELPAIPPVVRTPSPTSVPESDPPEIVDEAECEPGADYLSPLDQNLLFVESGRNSPGRYVHGAPLHNVLEEEEEGFD